MPGQANSAASLDAQVSVLGPALAQWDARDDTKAQPGVRRAANTAMAAIDDMLATLHRVRAELVSEIRQSDDAFMAAREV